MRLCFSTLACPEWTLEQIIDTARAHQLGVDFRGIGPELDITRLPAFNEQLDQTLARLREAGVELPCFNTSIRIVLADPKAWSAYLDECQRYALLAGKTGTRYLRIFGGAIPKEMSRAEAQVVGERHLRQLVKLCRPHGCMPVLETHDAWRTSAEVLELIQALSPGDVGVLWDIEHPYRAGEAVDQTARALAPYIRHIHIKDAVHDGDRYEARLLGEGDLPLRDALRALRSIGYDGWISLETEKRWHKSAPDPEQSIPQFARYVRGELNAK